MVVEWSGGGGLGHYAFLLADALAGEGVPATLATRKGHDLTGVPARHREMLAWPAAPDMGPGLRRKALVGAGRLYGWIRVTMAIAGRRGPRPVVHLQSIDQLPEVGFGLAARLLGARVMVTAHNIRPHDATSLQALIQRLGLRVPHAVIVHTRQAAEEIARETAATTPIRTLGHPSYRRLVELVDRPAAVARSRPRIGALGMIRPYKGLELVVGVFAGLRAGRDCELRIAGRASDPGWVDQLVADLPPGSASTRLGYLSLPDFIDELRGCDVLLLAHRSSSESGIAQLAVGAGVPVVGPRVGPLARLLGGRPEWLYDPGNTEDGIRRLGAVLDRVAADPASVGRDALALSDAAPGWDEMARLCLETAAELPARRP